MKAYEIWFFDFIKRYPEQATTRNMSISYTAWMEALQWVLDKSACAGDSSDKCPVCETKALIDEELEQ